MEPKKQSLKESTCWTYSHQEDSCEYKWALMLLYTLFKRPQKTILGNKQASLEGMSSLEDKKYSKNESYVLFNLESNIVF